MTWWAWLIIAVVAWGLLAFTVAFVLALVNIRATRRELKRASEINLGPRRRTTL